MKTLKIITFLIASLLLCLPLLISYSGSSQVSGRLISATEEGNVLYIDKYDLKLYGIDKNGTTFFCLPSYVALTEIDQGESLTKIYLPDGSLLRHPRLGEEQEIYVTANGEKTPWHICFLRSANLYSLFLETGSQDYSSISHDDYSSAKLTVVSPEGRTTYSDRDIQIKGRGNATWRGEKKPYEIRLSNNNSLCGMSASTKWTLLANYFEPTKIYNKLAFDISEAIGMEYSIESDWVDLYADGVYIGNYLLCHEPNISSSDLDITDLKSLNKPYFNPEKTFETETMKGYLYKYSADPSIGGFLIEKNTDSYYGHKDCGFKTPQNYFTLKSPDNASYEQIDYIRSFISGIDQRIHSSSPDVLSFIDTPSFTRRFIIEELFFNNDAFVTSYYYYKKPYEDRLYAGPVWDYDGTIGEGGGVYLDYNGTILDQSENIESEDLEFKNPLDWDALLYENNEYRSDLIETYKECLPVLESIVNNRIDAYQEKINASFKMDYSIWRRGWETGFYDNPSNNIRFLKFYLSKRLLYLCNKWNIDNNKSESDFSNETTHSLVFLYPDGSESEMNVQDGAQINPIDLPAYDSEKYLGWCYSETGAPFSYFVPIFEDTVLELIPSDQ